MPRRLSPGLAALLAFAAQVPGLQAQQAAPPRRKPAAPPLQSQIDALREGQEKLQRDLDELKALLKAQPARMESPAIPKPQDLITLNVGGEPFKGSALARVAILEYSDFDCSYCAKYATEVYPLLDHLYIQGGKVKYFFRDMPGQDHLNALFKARVARCAGDQDRFWEAHDLLFKDQRPFDAPGLARFAESLGLDGAQFNACVASDRHLDAINRSAMGAARLRLRGTPAFLIGMLSEDGTILRATRVIMGGDSLDAFRTVLDDMLKADASKPGAGQPAS
ncbi:MAG: thioredoxin domain-containing protein [Geothrix sp.]|uniref:DsbA family protein n=1 Tax=Geothrix sp. TaxID=1962974 RepID=UPI0018384EE3|nr:thioredoxin domain-containing protein [Geothrix sp.]NWJ42092.1 thioredoxin domain-containing protein [Geothrix sp.]WIL19940.1 MAG: DsbA family protein [Geothrix sp.]